jgi:hypothetical protein
MGIHMTIGTFVIMMQAGDAFSSIKAADVSPTDVALSVTR